MIAEAVRACPPRRGRYSNQQRQFSYKLDHKFMTNLGALGAPPFASASSYWIFDYLQWIRDIRWQD